MKTSSFIILTWIVIIGSICVDFMFSYLGNGP